MPPDLKTLERGWIKGLTRFEHWRQEFEEGMIKCRVEEQMKVMMPQMAPQQIAEIVRMQPELEETIELLQGG